MGPVRVPRSCFRRCRERRAAVWPLTTNPYLVVRHTSRIYPTCPMMWTRVLSLNSLRASRLVALLYSSFSTISCEGYSNGWFVQPCLLVCTDESDDKWGRVTDKGMRCLNIGSVPGAIVLKISIGDLFLYAWFSIYIFIYFAFHVKIFQQITNLRLPREGDRLKGFGYVDFEDRDSLVSAMNIADLVSETRLTATIASYYVLLSLTKTESASQQMKLLITTNLFEWNYGKGPILSFPHNSEAY